MVCQSGVLSLLAEKQGVLAALSPSGIADAVERYVKLECLEENFAEIQEKLNVLPESTAWFQRRFGRRIEFGTAGLRDVMGAGFGAMNHITVLQTTQGVCAHYSNVLGHDEMKKRGVVIGFDGRHNSKFFAHVAAAVFLSRDIPVHLFSAVTATPLTPFAVVHFGAACGIQVTASHNPKADNGYKLYGPNGAQIIPPTDVEIFNLIGENQEPWVGVKELVVYQNKSLFFAHQKMALVSDPLRQITQIYMAHMSKNLICPKLSETVKNSSLRIVYTAMHGVGYPFIQEIIVDKLGFPSSNFFPVPEQKFPDPEFSTAAFPNPEEKGALNLAIALADRVGAPLIVANDPDADRFAAAEKKADGSWHIFHGDELGCLFGHLAFEKAKAKGVDPKDMLFICSAVSSRMLQAMAVGNGANFVDTMTGFKWMMNKAIQLRDEKNWKPCLVYEEALGYALDMSCPDKDGVSAAAVWVEAACELHAKGSSFCDLLQSLREKFGFFVVNNNYYLCYEPAKLWELFGEFRNEGKYCSKIGDFGISRIRDATTGYDSAAENCKCDFPLTPAANMITLWFDNGAVVTLRTSGTEPKLKWYAEMSSDKPETAKAELQKLLDAIDHQVFQPAKYPLKKAGSC